MKFFIGGHQQKHKNKNKKHAQTKAEAYTRADRRAPWGRRASLKCLERLFGRLYNAESKNDAEIS